MLIRRVVVSGLFDRFNHDLVFRHDEQITIMIGPNGFGKTTILRILDTLFNKSLRGLGRMPFRNVIIYFNDDSTLKVSRMEDGTSSVGQLEIEYTKLSNREHYRPEASIDPGGLGIPISAIEDLIPSLDQISPREWRDVSTNLMLDLDEVLEIYGDQLPWEEDAPGDAKPDWLSEICEKIVVRLIDTERLTQPPIYGPLRRSTRWNKKRLQGLRTVRRYSEEFRERVQRTLSEYGSRAQSLDRTFPVRLVEEPAQTELTMEHLRQELEEVEKKRSSLVDAGLLAQEHEGPDVPPLEQIDESRRGVLAVYARDAKAQIEHF